MMSEEVKELLAKIGMNAITGIVPSMIKKFDPNTEQDVIIIPGGEPRRLVVDPDGAINWFDYENGPVA